MISRSNAVSFALGAAAVLVALPRDACDRSTGRRRLTTRSSFAADCAGAADAAACERTLEDSEALALASVKLKEAVASRKKYVKSEGGLRGLGRWRRYVLKKFDDSCERSVRRGEPCARAQIGNFSEDHEINFGGRTVYDRGRSSSSRFGTSGPALPVEDLVRGYEELFQATKLHSVTRWLGVPLQQDPSDAFAIADLLWRLQPDLVIELGTSGGGSAAFYAHVMNEYNPSSKLLTMDPSDGMHTRRPLVEWNWNEVMVACGADCVPAVRSRVWRDTEIIRYARVRPASAEGLAIAEAFVAKATKVLVIEDSDHQKSTVAANLAAYHRFVTPGSYFIVQDTRIGSAKGAVKEFLAGQSSFVADRRPEYYFITQHWGGYLYKRRAASDRRFESAPTPPTLPPQRNRV